MRVAMLQCGMVGVNATATVLSGSLTWLQGERIKESGFSQLRAPLFFCFLLFLQFAAPDKVSPLIASDSSTPIYKMGTILHFQKIPGD